MPTFWPGVENGRKPTEQDIQMFNDFMTKRGWRDEARKRLLEVAQKYNLPDSIETWFDLIETDEERL